MAGRAARPAADRPGERRTMHDISRAVFLACERLALL